jgi:hypothetical protein
MLEASDSIEKAGNETISVKRKIKDCDCIMRLAVFAPGFACITHKDGRLKTLEKYHNNNNNNKTDHNRQHQAFRDMKTQNEWLRTNCFDSTGNYLYCPPCIRRCFRLSFGRLKRIEQSFK